MKKLSKEKNLKFTIIGLKIAVAVAVVMIMINVIGSFGSKAKTEKCTAAMQGVVTEVERYHASRHSTKYKAFVTSADAPGKVFESIYTVHEYRKGDRVAICYDPEDTDNYYIEYADPESENLILILSSSLLLIVIIILIILKSRKYKKLYGKQDTLSE